MPKIPRDDLQPFWQTTDEQAVRLYLGNVTDVLKELPAKSVHCVVTSPPYWGLRDYGNDKSVEIGSEKTPQEFVAKMVEVFRAVHRVLRDDGTLWLNLGDTYSGGSGGSGTDSAKQQSNNGTMIAPRQGLKSMKSGNLVGIPWRVALALQEDGWILRQDIIWSKPSPMPESVKNRCTKAHEYVFLFAKKQRYFYDAEAVKDKSLQPEGKPERTGSGKVDIQYPDNGTSTLGTNQGMPNKNKRSVWTVSSQGYAGAHFATFPPKLVEPMILAGTSAKGCCADCGAPWKRIVQEKQLKRERPNEYVKRTGEEGTGNSCANTVAGVETKTVGWEPTCDCEGEIVPCVVLDPFMGSGTTACVALANGRHAIGVDLSAKYLKNNAVPRIEGTLMSIPALSNLIPREKREMLKFGKSLLE